MGKRKGSPKSGGRKAGTPNRTTVLKAKAIAAAGEIARRSGMDVDTMTPLDILLFCARKYLTGGNLPGAVQAAGLAAPYMHPKLVVVDQRIRNELGEMPPEELQRQIERERRALEHKRAWATRGRMIELEAEPAQNGADPGIDDR
jgi:hypothetical protein